MEGVQPSQPQEKKPSHPEAVAQSLLVVRGDDKAAQDEEKIDEKPGVAQERHSVQMAVGVQMEQGHQARSDSAPAVQYHESFHVRPERLVCLGRAAHSDVQTIRLRLSATITRRSSTALPPWSRAGPVPGIRLPPPAGSPPRGAACTGRTAAAYRANRRT